jgi:cytoskeletal protein CcmA (bactofilin family)
MAWLGKKDEPEIRQPEPDPRATAALRQPLAAPAPPPISQPKAERSMVDKIVHIGQSVYIKGELTGNEDLTIEGKVDGKITLKDHHLTIGANGRIMAEIHAKTVLVVGEVVGNVIADDKVEVASNGSMKGDIIAPRVVLADGARFKGTVDMERKAAPAPAASVHPPKPQPVMAEMREPVKTTA